MANLTNQQIRDIINNVENKTGRALAEQYGVTPMFISRLRKNPPAYAVAAIESDAKSDRAALMARVLAMPPRPDALTDAQVQAINKLIAFVPRTREEYISMKDELLS